MPVSRKLHRISLDTETTGIDLIHGAMPFIVTTCSEDGTIQYWEWDVNPLTRKPEIPSEDLQAITDLINSADLIYLQNAKFDARALMSIGIELPWHKVRDTLVMGHLLASNHPHNLTDMCIEYLGIDIEKYEIDIKGVTQTARAIVKKEYPDWRIADEGLPEMPSVKVSGNRDEDKPWKNDMWLPRALIKAGSRNYIPDHWGTSASDYSNADSEHTLPLGFEMEKQIRERGLWKIYEHRLHLPRVACEMECYGTTVIGSYTESTIADYTQYVAEAGAELTCIADGYGHELELPSGVGLNDNMREFFYGSIRQLCLFCKYVKNVKHWNDEQPEPSGVCPKCAGRKRNPMRYPLTTKRRDNLAMPVINGKKSGNASLDKDVMQEYLTSLDEGPALDFVKLLMEKRKHDTDLTYMQAYKRFWLPIKGHEGFYRIHPSLNPFGTNHLRWASNSPNLQNVGQQEDKCEECDGKGCAYCNHTGKSRMSVRHCFGPAPDREWYTMDYKSIERRLPVYECGEPKMVEVFEKPNQAPYWGNLYNLTASVLYPGQYWPLAETEGLFRKEYPRLYKQAKFFDLAKQYACGRKKGDLLSKVENSFDKVDNEFPLFAKLQTHYLRFAEKFGYVETLPDKTVDPTRGYPILPSRTDDGRVMSTTPFNYHVSGTACWCKNTAAIRCSNQLAQWRKEGFDGHMPLDIHDEIIFDFPRGKTWDENLPRAVVLRKLMEESGENLVPRIPTPVSINYHAVSWAEGRAV